MGGAEGSLDASKLGKSEVCSEARELARPEVYSDESELQQEFLNERIAERERLAYTDGTVYLGVAIVTPASPLGQYWRSRRKRGPVQCFWRLVVRNQSRHLRLQDPSLPSPKSLLP